MGNRCDRFRKIPDGFCITEAGNKKEENNPGQQRRCFPFSSLRRNSNHWQFVKTKRAGSHLLAVCPSSGIRIASVMFSTEVVIVSRSTQTASTSGENILGRRCASQVSKSLSRWEFNACCYDERAATWNWLHAIVSSFARHKIRVKRPLHLCA